MNKELIKMIEDSQEGFSEDEMNDGEMITVILNSGA